MMMTFRKAFYLSIAAHIMIFGSAIAFAQFSGALLSSSHRALTIALVSSGPSAGQGERPAARRRAQSMPTAVPAAEANKTPFPKRETEPDAASLRPAADLKQQQGGHTGDDNAASKTASMGAGQGTSDQVGSMMPSKWDLLVAAIERAKNYPRLAKERGIEGVVWLRVLLAPSGLVEKTEILQSSGYEILDSEAVRTVYRAAPLPYVTADWVRMPIRYELKP